MAKFIFWYYLLFLITKTRLCVSTVVERFYEFNVSYTSLDLDGKGPVFVQSVPKPEIPVIMINGQVPGPTVWSRPGDRLTILLRNQLSTESVAIRWHGLLLPREQAYLDGVRGVTQCPLSPGAEITLSWIVNDEPGTYLYWDTKPSSVGARGLYGAFVILDDSDDDINIDSSNVVVVSDFYRKPIGNLISSTHGRLSAPAASSLLNHRIGIFPLNAVLTNGIANSGLVFGRKLRLVNAAAVFSFKVSLQMHALDVISADGSPVVPFRCISVIIAPGERFDVEVVDPLTGQFELSVETLEATPRNSTAFWFLSDESFVKPIYTDNFLESRSEGLKTLPIINCFDIAAQSLSCLPVTVLRSSNPPLRPFTNEEIFVWEMVMRETSASGLGHFVRLQQVDFSNGPIGDPNIGLDRWKSTHLAGEFVQHQLPAANMPVLYHGQGALHPHSLVLNVNEGDWVDVVFNAVDRQSVPWHITGHKFLILGIGHANPDTDCNLIRCESPWYGRDVLDYHDGQDFLSTGDVGIWKDTVVVPPGGWVVVRFKAKAGWWPLSSSSEPLSADGFGILIHVRNGTISYEDLPVAFKATCAAANSEQEVANCSCREDPMMIFDSGPRDGYKCSRPHLCTHENSGTIPFRGVSAFERVFFIFLAIASFFLLFRQRILRKRKQRQQVDEVHTTPQASPTNRDSFLSPIVPGDGTNLVMPTMPSLPGQPSSETDEEVSLSPQLLSPQLSNAQSISLEDADPTYAMSKASLRQRRGSFGAKRESVTQRAECLSTYRSFILSDQNDMRLVWAGLTVGRGSETIMDGVAGALNPGEMLAVLGPSGSGKTLLLNLLAGTRLKNAAKLTEGAILFGGTPFHQYSSESLRSLRSFLGEDQMQFAASDGGSMGQFTVFEMLCFYAQLQKPREDLADTIIDSYVYEGIIHVGLEGCAGQKVNSLSSSQRRRVALCAEMLFPRPILLLDGAFLGLDVNSKMNLTLWCQEIAVECGAIIIMTVSSPPSKVLPLFNKLLILQKGGYPVYFGPTDKAPDYFDAMGMRVPPLWNPSDWYMEVLDFNKRFPRIISGGVDWDDLEAEELPALSLWVADPDDSYSSDETASQASKQASGFVARVSGQIQNVAQKVKKFARSNSSMSLDSNDMGSRRNSAETSRRGSGDLPSRPPSSRRGSGSKKRPSESRELLRCPSADSNLGELDDGANLTEEMINKVMGTDYQDFDQTNTPDRIVTPTKTPPRGDGVSPEKVTPRQSLAKGTPAKSPRTSILDENPRRDSDRSNSDRSNGTNSPEKVTPRQSLVKEQEKVTPRQSLAKGTPAKSPRTSILDERPPSSRSVADRGTPARSSRTSILDDATGNYQDISGPDRNNTPPKVTPPQTTRNSLVPPRSMSDKPSEVSYVSDQGSIEVRAVMDVSQSQRSSCISTASSSNSFEGSTRSPRRSNVSIEGSTKSNRPMITREGSLGNVQVRVKKRRRSSGQKDSEVSLNVAVMSKRGVSQKLSRQRSWIVVLHDADTVTASKSFVTCFLAVFFHMTNGASRRSSQFAPSATVHESDGVQILQGHKEYRHKSKSSSQPFDTPSSSSAKCEIENVQPFSRQGAPSKSFSSAIRTYEIIYRSTVVAVDSDGSIPSEDFVISGGKRIEQLMMAFNKTARREKNRYNYNDEILLGLRWSDIFSWPLVYHALGLVMAGALGASVAIELHFIC